ncbi:tudor domain-containing protein 1, partial [Brachyistius frenatus]|uniref:tudor domain-containing protein 1 n=1 Tax=Brachyistius frenatus TaxID=100188 RepID=UPI0037E8456B
QGTVLSTPVRPNLPLRKPSSRPAALPTTLPPPRHPVAPGVTPVRPASGATGDGKSLSGSATPALTGYFCNFCGQQGSFRCKRCKMSYCSVVCQTEDWKEHKYLCTPVDPGTAVEKPKETSALPVVAETTSLLKLEYGDPSSPHRVFLKDLPITKVIKGTDIQASVVEFDSPGRFFLIPQSPELLEALQNISTELQKTYSCSSVTTYVPCVGEVCAVQFSCDLNWYRGLVQTLDADQTMANILYIDFGNEENVPVERTRPLAANIQPFCPCAMECCTAEVVPLVSHWSGESCFAVRQLVAGKTVTAKLVETLENSRMHAIDILLHNGKQLSTFLLEQGYARKEVTASPTKQDINAMVSASLENFKCHSDGKDDNTWAQPPEPLTQAVGDQLSVAVTHFKSPSQLIVQKVENAGVIQNLQLKLRNYCCQVAASPNFRPAPGTVCCAQFSEDKQWYRAKVLAYSSGEHVCVGYLDFGNSEEVDLGLLRPISTSLLAVPTQAIPCGLAGVQPVGEEWSEECLLALQQRVSNRILHIEIQGAHEGTLLVAMIDEASDPQANVAELLISAGYAVTASSDLQAEETTTAETQVSPPVCEPLVWSCTELPCHNQTVALLASVVENPEEFYCHINNPADHRLLMELGPLLKHHCEADASPFMPKVGEPCCTMFPGDGAWYRATVKGSSEDMIAVNLVDYGYSMEVKKSHLRSITPQLLTLPFQAIRCWLTGVEPLGSEWTSEALLRFQTLVVEELSARVLSVTERGYGVDLESRGQNVAAVLISEQLAKVPGETAKETHEKTASSTKQQERVKQNEHQQSHVRASSQTEASPTETPAEGKTAKPSEVPLFPVDWKTVALPPNETFQPYVAAVVSPVLFYLLGPTQVNQRKLQEVMMELAAYCSNNQATLSSAVKSRPAPGAACCAQFSADNKWYRAVVLEVGENETSVIYADYGNSEKVPFSRIMSIPMHLLQLPFQIVRCTITGKERFPAEWPEEVQQLFRTLPLTGVLATVQSFDGSANVLSLTLPAESGGVQLTDTLLDALRAHSKSNPRTAAARKADQTDGSSSTPIGTTAAPDCPQPKSVPRTQSGPGPLGTAEPTKTPEPKAKNVQQKESPSAASANEDPVKQMEPVEPPCQKNSNIDDHQTSDCCCLSLKNKVDHLEQLMQLQLALLKHLVAQTK